MSTSYLCPHCQRTHPRMDPCHIEDIIRAYSDVTALQQSLVDRDETLVLVRWAASRTLPPVKCDHCGRPRGHAGKCDKP